MKFAPVGVMKTVMFEVLTISIPFFALIFLGYGARRVDFAMPTGRLCCLALLFLWRCRHCFS